MRCLSYKICLKKTVQVDTRFYQDRTTEVKSIKHLINCKILIYVSSTDANQGPSFVFFVNQRQPNIVFCFLVTFVKMVAYLLFDWYHAVRTSHQTQFGVALLQEAERTAIECQEIRGAPE